jgi:glycosyltransferase involved in cell wall biosynthesis
MRVGILMQGLEGRQTGVARYMQELLRAMAALPDRPEIVILTDGDLTPLGPALEKLERVQDQTLNLLFKLMGWLTRLIGFRLAYILIGSIIAPLASRRLRLDLIHDLTGLLPNGFGAGGARVVTTLHDLISFANPGTNDWMDDLVQFRWLPLTAPKVDAMITVSRSAGEDAVRYLKMRPQQIHVVHHGVLPIYQQQPQSKLEAVRSKYGLPPEYILFVGAVVERKNLRRMLEACATLWARGEGLPLVVVGPTSARSSGILAAVEASGLSHRVQFTDYVPESDLPALYAAASVFVYPSLYEGFGIPVIEAMACGTPVITSKVSSLPEVAGEAALTVDPNSSDAIRTALERLLSSQDLREDLRARGLVQAAQFTWERAARETLMVYRQTVSKPLPSKPELSA